MIFLDVFLKKEIVMTEEVANKVKEIIAEKLGVDRDKVVDNARFVDDLGADSLDTVELVMKLEEEFAVEIPNQEGESIQSVKDAIDFIEKNL